MEQNLRKPIWKELWKYKDLVKQLVFRDIKLKYRRSFLGYVWSVLNPLLIMIVLTIVFSTMFSRDIENFPVYLFTGQLLYNFMSHSTHQAIFSITGNGALLKKTYLPKYIFTISKITSGLVDFVFSLGALVIVMLATKATFSWYALLFPIVVLQLYIFSLGLGLFLAQANVFFRDIQYIYNAITTAWMYLTPILYPIERLPEWLRWMVEHLNPMYFFIEQFRDIVYYCRPIRLELMMWGFIIAIAMLIFGGLCFKRSQDRFILYI
jgi:lipopolysaccharide transport system permease protein